MKTVRLFGVGAS